MTLHVCEEGLRLTEEASHRLNRPISTWCMLLDLEGIIEFQFHEKKNFFFTFRQIFAQKAKKFKKVQAKKKI